MKISLTLFIVIFVACSSNSLAHAPGEEFTYLSMFLKPDPKNGKSGNFDFATLAKQYVKVQTGIGRKGRRNLAAIDEAILGLEGGESRYPNNRQFRASSEMKEPVSVETIENSFEERKNFDELDRQTHDIHGENVEKLSSMLLNVVKQYKARSMVDVPCRAHAHWMSVTLKSIYEYDPDFKYYCVDTNRKLMKQISRRISTENYSRFVVSQFWKHELPPADIVFSWSGLDNMKEENVLQYVKMLAESGDRHSVVLIGSHTGSTDEGVSNEVASRFSNGGNPINLKEWPFELSEPWRIISDLCTDGNDKQLYVYKPSDMRRSKLI